LTPGKTSGCNPEDYNRQLPEINPTEGGVSGKNSGLSSREYAAHTASNFTGVVIFDIRRNQIQVRRKRLVEIQHFGYCAPEGYVSPACHPA